jgi:hypothetical protein
LAKIHVQFWTFVCADGVIRDWGCEIGYIYVPESNVGGGIYKHHWLLYNSFPISSIYTVDLVFFMLHFENDLLKRLWLESLLTRFASPAVTGASGSIAVCIALSSSDVADETAEFSEEKLVMVCSSLAPALTGDSVYLGSGVMGVSISVSMARESSSTGGFLSPGSSCMPAVVLTGPASSSTAAIFESSSGTLATEDNSTDETELSGAPALLSNRFM